MDLQIFTFLLLNFDSVWLIPPQLSLASSQFFIQNEDGSYSYGYNTGTGLTAEQISDSQKASEQYVDNDDLSAKAEVPYVTSVETFFPNNSTSDFSTKSSSAASETLKNQSSENVFKIVVPDSEEEHSDSDDNFQLRSASYNNPQNSDISQKLAPSYTHNLISASNVLNTDGSYNFSYSFGDSSREEAKDAANNVQGRYSYKDEAGYHDLSYIAGDETGYLITGGSLAIPNGLRNHQTPSPDSAIFYALPFEKEFNDSSYSFEYSTPQHSRQEIGDSKGNVYGRYSFVNEEGNHDLRYIAGSKTGFLPIGGSLLKSAGAGGKILESEQTDLEDLRQRSKIKSFDFLPKLKTNTFERKISKDESGSANVNENEEKLKNQQNFTLKEQINVDQKKIIHPFRTISRGGDNYYQTHDSSSVPVNLQSSFVYRDLLTSLPIATPLINNPTFNNVPLETTDKTSSTTDLENKNFARLSEETNILPPVVVYTYLPPPVNRQYGYSYNAVRIQG